MDFFTFLIGTITMMSFTMAQYLKDIGVKYSDFCPKSSLCGENKTHIVCRHEESQTIKSNAPCEEEPHFVDLGENHRNAIIKHLNGFRAQIVKSTALGDNGNSIPKAYGLYKLQWDQQLAAFAQILSNLCTFKSDECRATFNKSQNYTITHPTDELPISTSLDRFSDPDQVLGRKYYTNWKLPGDEKVIVNKTIEAIIGFWRNQRKSLLPNHVRSVPLNKSEISAYMKILNSNLTHVGCGIAAYTKKSTEPETAGKRHVVQFICNLSHTPKPGAPLYPMAPEKGDDEYGCKIGEDHTIYGLCIGSNRTISEHDAINTKPSTLTTKPSTMTTKPNTKTKKPSTMTTKPSTMTTNLSTMTTKISTMSTKPSTITTKPIETQTITSTTEGKTPTKVIIQKLLTSRFWTTEMPTTNTKNKHKTSANPEQDFGDPAVSPDECPPPALVLVPIVTVEDDDNSTDHKVISQPIGKIRDYIEIKVTDENNNTVDNDKYDIKMQDEFLVDADNQTFVVPELEKGQVKRVKINIPLYVLKTITEKYNFSIPQLTKRLMESIIISDLDLNDSSKGRKDVTQPPSNKHMTDKHMADNSKVEMRHIANIQRMNLPEREPSKAYKYDDVERLYKMVSNQNVEEIIAFGRETQTVKPDIIPVPDETDEANTPFVIQDNFPNFTSILDKFGNVGTINSDENKISKKSGKTDV